MTTAEQLEKVKQSLNIKGNALDDPLGILLDDVKLYMADAGVTATMIASDKAIGAICRGVADLYIDKELSSYFYQRVTQLAIQADEEPEPQPTDNWVKYCGVTSTLTLSDWDVEFENVREIYKKGDELKVKYEANITLDKAITGNTQLKVATIDDRTAYPAEPVYCNGIVYLDKKWYSATFKIWEHGDISLTTDAELLANADISLSFSGQYSFKG